ncbi:hypothetical protein GUITHDRAFT_112986 [Guillardia theta CCMP2712]|uniref:Uncharacterized protein n=1 Tax=Guillardia theta (strain CCMP2712) TaxID=905079 RepID=L1IY07_GUITC|nr:hypothetical protein GUITHDRAFT_112986 [Guillardia theta CCMP2712]EKX40982.1 hypothetical protein GUITHDRAFT_112986 [Guillardia theta CCMP2712]|eukprot:XP_005827962.1 hypothetical protein GUITHDRAFT_112986 [Guillardia theta CCMP2712]
MDTKTVAIRTKAKEAASSINTDMLMGRLCKGDVRGARGSGGSKEDNKEKNHVCPMSLERDSKAPGDARQDIST